MKLVIFALIFMALVAFATLAAGLEVTEIDANVDYDEAYTYRIEGVDRKDSASVSVANGSKIDVDLLPGSNITFAVTVENTFKEEKLDLRGVFVTITIEEIDDGADLEEDSIDFDLEPGDDNRVDVKFQIPLGVDAGTYNAVLEAQGEDRNETSYNTKLNLKLEVKKQSHDIRITKVLLSPSVVDCNRKAKLTAEIMNLGSNAENQVALEFKATSLGVNSYDKDISLESSDEASIEEKVYTKTLNVEAPTFFEPGTFPIFVNLYWKNFVLFDQKAVNLVVKDCISAKKEEIKEQIKEEPVIVIQPKNESKEQIKEEKEEPITSTQETFFSNSRVLLSIFLGSLVVIVFAFLIVAGYLKRKQH